MRENHLNKLCDCIKIERDIDEVKAIHLSNEKTAETMKKLVKGSIPALLLATIFLAPLHAQAQAAPPAPGVGAASASSASKQPSFDCRKAASISEKTICGNAELSRLDFQLGRTWKTLLDAFSDPAKGLG